MKRFLIIFVSLVILLAFFSFMVSLSNHSALAIDRAPKESKAKEKLKPAEEKELEKKGVKEGKIKGIDTPEKKSEKTKRIVPDKWTKWQKSREKQKAKEKYDYFIDKNSNGIDDRLERKSKKPVSTPAVRPVPKEKQPTKPAPSIKETEKKKEVREAPKKKEVKEANKIEGKKRR